MVRLLGFGQAAGRGSAGRKDTATPPSAAPPAHAPKARQPSAEWYVLDLRCVEAPRREPWEG